MDSIITITPPEGFKIHSIDFSFDGKWQSERGWAYDEKLKTHSITKISIWYTKHEGGMISDARFVVTLPNKKMYFYQTNEEIFNGVGKEEGPYIVI